MTLKKQFKTLKENWLILILVIVLVIVLNGNFFGGGVSLGFDGLTKSFSVAQESNYYRTDSDFAPEVEERIKTTTASLSTEVERGNFYEEELTMKSIVEDYNAYLLNENVRKSETGFWETQYGSYTIKIDSNQYKNFVSELKSIGEVQSFNVNVNDITGQYTDLEIELELEKDKLNRYKNLYDEAINIEDKISLENMIASQERTIRYLEDSIDNFDKRVDYSTIYFSMNEKRSEYANVALVKLSALVKSFVDSVNNLLGLLFVVIPWAIGLLIVWKVYKKFKR